MLSTSPLVSMLLPLRVASGLLVKNTECDHHLLVTIYVGDCDYWFSAVALVGMVCSWDMV